MESHHQHTSPVSALSPQDNHHHVDRDANAPEAVDASMTPTTFMGSPATDYSHPRTATSRDGSTEGGGGGGGGAKEVVTYDKSEKIAVPTANEYHSSPYPQVVGDPDAERVVGGHQLSSSSSSAPPPKNKKSPSKILGLSRKAFFITLALLCIVIIAAVGGGVGGSLASKKSKSSNGSTDAAATSPPTTTPPKTTPPSSSSTATSSTTTSTARSSTSSSAAKPTATFLNRTNTDSGHFFQGFSKVNMTGDYSPVVNATDGTDFDFGIRSYEYIARNTNCCVSFCTNATAEGWLGYLCESRKQNAASEPFSRVFVWCNDKHTTTIARGQCGKK